MSTKNGLPFSNQFERGHSFNWAGKWTAGKYYMNDEYVTDFIVHQNVILVCRKNHQAVTEPQFIYKDGKIIDVDSPFWEFILSPEVQSDTAIQSATFIAKATIEDHIADPTVIIGDPYIKMFFSSGAYLYVPVKDIITQYKVGVPILTQEMYDDLPDCDKPDPYIIVPSESDLTEPGHSNYLNIVFSAIRKLQAEVAKLRNSFQYGIQSYVGTDTAMSEVVDSYKYLNDKEPLWSVESDNLSEIPDATLNLKSSVIIPPLYPQENIEYSGTGMVKINNYVTWTDPETGFLSIGDTKIFLYITSTSLNYDINLRSIDDPDNNLSFNIGRVVQIQNPNSDMN